jgi:hypothetical protein
MQLTRDLLDRCEQYLQKIDTDPMDAALKARVHAVRGYLCRNLDGWTKAGKESFAYGILRNLEGTWDLVTEREKSCDCTTCQFNSITLALREICHERLLLDQLPKKYADQDHDESDREDDFSAEKDYIDDEDKDDEFEEEIDADYSLEY